MSKKRILLLFFALLFVCLLIPVAGWAAGGTWPQFQNDLYNDGLTTDSAPLSSASVAWQQQVGNTSMAGINHTPLVAGGSVFAMDAFGKLWSFDMKTGTEKWSTQLSCSIKQFQLSTPAYDSGKLYAATNDGHVYALDAGSGSILWDIPLQLASKYSQLNTPVKYVDGKIYIGAWNPDSASNEFYYCLDAVTGAPGIGGQYQMQNSACGGGYYWTGACIVGKYMIFGSERSTLTCLDKDTGVLISSVSLKVYSSGAKEIRSSVSYDSTTGMVFMTDQGGNCWSFKFDSDSGNLIYLWNKTIDKTSTSTPAVYDGKLYVGSGTYASRGGLYCLDEQTGSELWNFMPTGDGEVSVPGVQASPAIAVQNGTPYIYFASICENSLVYCLDQNGNQVWQFAVPNYTYTTTSIAVADGWLYLGNDYGWLYALKGTAVPVTGVSLNKTTDTITVGATDTLIANIAPVNATNQSVTWVSDNTAAAAVDQSGKVTAVAQGTANVTATTADGGYTATCVVTVTGGGGGGGSSTTSKVNLVIKDKNGSTRFNNNISVQAGDTVMDVLFAAAEKDSAIDPQVEWENAYIMGGYVWSIYGVESPWGKMSEGWVFQVNGVMSNKGAAKYIVSDGNNILWEWSAMEPVTGITLDKTSSTVNVGGTVQLNANIKPANASNRSINWTSDNTAVATVDSDGKVTGVSAGSAKITAATADGGYKATCVVTVQAAAGGSASTTGSGISLNKTTDTIKIGATDQLTVTISATGVSDQDIKWTSDNTTVATVDSKGMVTGVSVGTAKITAATADGRYTATCVVTVQSVEPAQQVQQTVQPQSQTQSQSAVAFEDLQAGYWAREAIEYMVAGGYLKGYEDGTFRPDQPITRAEFTALTVKVMGLQEADGRDIFKDVHSGDWYYDIVNIAFTHDLVSGYGDGMFGPNEPVTREQVVSMISRVLAQKEGQQKETAVKDEILQQFNDAGEISDWARPAVAIVINKGIVNGYEDGTFRPNSPATRAECVVMLRKLLP
jgi:uncharacterized protein YjdB/outer membrane protein assembly factor BamB